MGVPVGRYLMIRASMRKSSSSCSEHTSGSVWAQKGGWEGGGAVSHRGQRLLAEGCGYRDHGQGQAHEGAPSYLYSHLQGAGVVGHSRHLTFIHLPKRAVAQTPVQRRRCDEAGAHSVATHRRQGSRTPPGVIPSVWLCSTVPSSMGKKGSKPGFMTLADIPSMNTY